MAYCGNYKIARGHKGGGSDLADIIGYYPHLGYSEEGFEGEMFQPVVPNQELPLISSQKVLG